MYVCIILVIIIYMCKLSYIYPTYILCIYYDAYVHSSNKIQIHIDIYIYIHNISWSIPILQYILYIYTPYTSHFNLSSHLLGKKNAASSVTHRLVQVWSKTAIPQSGLWSNPRGFHPPDPCMYVLYYIPNIDGWCLMVSMAKFQGYIQSSHPRCSMGLAYLSTWMVDFCGKV